MVAEKSVTENFGYRRKEGRTERRTGGKTDRAKPVYPPLLQSWCIDKISDWLKLKGFGYSCLNVAQMMEFQFDGVENIVENSGY